MVGVLLVTHGNFAEGILDGISLIFGEQEDVSFVSLRMEDDVEEFGNKVYEKALEVDEGDGTLILVDFLGGSPENVTCPIILKEKNMECVTGLNFPMLLDVFDQRYVLGLQELKERCLMFGKDGIIDLRKKLEASMASDDEDDD